MGKKQKRAITAERQGYYLLCKDYHHLLFQKRFWNNGTARILRDHPYCGDYIPQATLHRAIHSRIKNVPLPPNCRSVLRRLEENLRTGEFSYSDCLAKRAENLALLFAKIEGGTDTAIALIRQAALIADFWAER